MSTKPRPIHWLRSKPELWTLINYFIITAATTGIGLLFRHILLCFRGSYSLSFLGKDFTVDIGDNLAYTTYYVTSVIAFYLWKWAISDGRQKRSFIPRFLGYCALNVVSIIAGNWLLTVLLGWGVNSEVAFWLTCPLTFLINYLGSRLVVFRDLDDRSAGKTKEQKSERAESDGGKE